MQAKLVCGIRLYIIGTHVICNLTCWIVRVLS
jgi:hypothetical protein